MSSNKEIDRTYDPPHEDQLELLHFHVELLYFYFEPLLHLGFNLNRNLCINYFNFNMYINV